MRKTFQPTTRKVYAGSPQSNVVSSIGGQTTTVRRVGANSLLSPDQNSPRILKQSTIATTPSRVVTQQQQHSAGSANSSSNSPMKCYICDCFVGGQGQLLMETSTNTTQTKLPNKIGRVIGDSFLVIVRADDIVCRRCVGLFNQFDQLETQLETVKNQLMGFITKKYAIDGTDDSSLGAPAAKLQKMNSGAGVDTTPSSLKPIPSQPNTVVRKVVAQTLPVSPGSRKAPVKIYKCMSCDFTTSDLKQFTPHYNVCPGVSADNNGSSVAATNHQTTATTTVANSVQTQQTASPAVNKVVQRRPLTQSLQKAEAAASAVSSPAQHSCSQCPFKTASRQVYEEHMRRHQVKVKPFKCRICSARFEDRETASKHARAHSTEYYKCGTCSVAYRDRNQLIKHFEVHRNDGTGGQQIIIKASSTNVAKQQLGGKTGPAIVGQPQLASTQRLLQETIDEACNEAAVDTKNIHFFSCAICSLTFIQENYYTAHMETHKEQSGVTATKKTASSPAAGKQQVGRKTANGQSLIKGENDDLESIFEKMHSEKGGGQQGNDVSSTGIDMPALDQGDDEGNASQEASVPVSMPSLDDDENAAAEQAAAQEAAGNAEGGVPMEIDDMQNSADGGEQLKFVLSENGQLLQLDNHILTDAEGNQLIVQGGDPEHLQQLLQSVGLEGSTLQMIQGENNQMILVQQDGEQAQLIDASMLNVDGQIVLQQAQGGDGEMSQDGVEPEGEEGHHQQQGEEGEAQQVQFDASDVAHQEAAAVLAAAADQHVLLQAAVAEAASGVDENSQEDLGGAGGEGATAEGDAHHEETSQDEVSASQAETQQMAEGEEQQHGEEENSQEAVAAGSEEEHQQQQQQQEADSVADNPAAGADEDYDQLIPTC